jgi:hypothetical protein
MVTAAAIFRGLQKPGQIERIRDNPKGKAQKRFHLIDITPMSLSVALDSGRYLGFRRAPSTDSWKFAGNSYVLKMTAAKFCLDKYGDETPDYSGGTNNADENNGEQNIFDIEDYGVPPLDEDVMTTWAAGSLNGQLMKCCIYHS